MKLFTNLENYLGSIITEGGIFGKNGFFDKYKYIILITFLAGIFTNITDISNLYYGFDSIDEIYEDYFDKFVYLNLRFGSAILYRLLPFLSIYGISQVVGIFILTLTSILIVSRFNFSIVAKAMFCILFVTHPIWSHLEMFHFQYAYNVLGVLGAVGACLILLNGYEKHSSFKLYLIISILLLTFVIAIYQSTLTVFANVAILLSFFKYFEERNLKKSLTLILLAVAVAIISIIIYYILCLIITSGFGTYQNSAISFYNDTPIIHTLGNMFTEVYRFLFGIRKFSGTHGLNASILFIISLIIIFIKYKGNNRGSYILLALLFLGATILYPFFIGKGIWMYFNLPVYFAAAFLLIYLFVESRILKGLVLIFACFTLFQNIGSVQINQQAQIVLQEQEKMIVQRVLGLVYDVAPEVYRGEKSLVFIGYMSSGFSKHDHTHHPLLRRAHPQFTATSLGHNMQEYIQRFFALYGLPTNVTVINEFSSLYNFIDQIANDDPRYLLSVDIQRDMPMYPDRGCVRVEDDFVIVKLSELKD